MTSEPQATPPPAGQAAPDSVEMPRPTAAPVVMAAGMVLLAAGVPLGLPFLVVGAVVLVAGLSLWISQLLPGRGHVHEALAEPASRLPPVAGVPGGVERLREGVPGYRLRLPQDVHPISAGVKGGIVGGMAMPVPALLWGLLSSHHSLWYPINLLAGMVLPTPGNMNALELDQFLEQFHGSLLLVAITIHVVLSVVIGLIYGVLLPTLPSVPQSMAWAALLAPVVWTGVSYSLLGVVNPGLRDGVSWPWFILSQFVYGMAVALVVTQATGLSPVARGLAGGVLGGVLMPLPAVLWSLGTDRGVWYPLNLLAAMVIPGHNDASASELREFHANWLALALLMHGTLSLGFAVACALLLPKLRSIPGPLAWGGLVLPLLWTGTSYGLMAVVNPVLQERVDWVWFVVSQFVFGVTAAVVVLRSELVHIPPAGRGPDRVADFVTGDGGGRS
jgi:hypothetical protein